MSRQTRERWRPAGVLMRESLAAKLAGETPALPGLGNRCRELGTQNRFNRRLIRLAEDVAEEFRLLGKFQQSPLVFVISPIWPKPQAAVCCE